MGFFRYRVGGHRRYRTNGRVEKVRRYRRRPRRIRWRVITDDLFAGLAALVETSGSTLMRVLTITFAVLAAIAFVIVAPFAYLMGHRFGPQRGKAYRSKLRRRARSYKRAKVKTIKRTLGHEHVRWTPEQRRVARSRVARSRNARR